MAGGPVVVLLVLFPFANVLCDDHFFALLSGTLKTFQKAACDDQHVSLRCPPGTCISVLIAQYGNSAKDLQDLCPEAHGPHVRNNLTCPFPTSLQTKWEATPEGTWGKYSLLQTVVEACHKKRQCKFHASPSTFDPGPCPGKYVEVAYKWCRPCDSTVVEACHKKRQCKFHASPSTFGPDPCPGYRKYIEVAYKCRPYEFRSKVACQDDTLQLSCNPHSRVAVYSASFGRTEYESVRCPQPQGVREETCLATYATETVMQICHGKRQCSLTADAATFGNPCHHLSKTYLKVVYTCVPKTVLREQFEDGAVEEDEGDEPDYDVDYDSVDNALRENHVYSESPRLAVAGGRTNDSASVATQDTADKGEEEFKETRNRIVVSLVFAIVSGVMLMVALVIARCLWARRRFRPRPGDKQLTKVYSEEADQEIDLTATTAVTVLPSPHIAPPQEVIRYKEETPLSMGTNTGTDYYYG